MVRVRVRVEVRGCGLTLAATCERPKSASLARPSAVSSKFSGLRSRWQMPTACLW